MICSEWFSLKRTQYQRPSAHAFLHVMYLVEARSFVAINDALCVELCDIVRDRLEVLVNLRGTLIQPQPKVKTPSSPVGTENLKNPHCFL